MNTKTKIIIILILIISIAVINIVIFKKNHKAIISPSDFIKKEEAKIPEKSTNNKKIKTKLKNKITIKEDTPSTESVKSKLSQEKKEENRKEIELMKKILPKNVWVPQDLTKEQSEQQRALLKNIIILENKIHNKSATVEDKNKYYKYKIKEIKDKIELIKYYQQRTKELFKKTGGKYLSKDSIIQGNTAIIKLENKQKKYRIKLSELSEKIYQERKNYETREKREK